MSMTPEFWSGAIWTLLCVLVGAFIAGIIALYRGNRPGGKWDWNEWEDEVAPRDPPGKARRKERRSPPDHDVGSGSSARVHLDHDLLDGDDARRSTRSGERNPGTSGSTDME